MATSTGPILGVGAITITADVIFQGKPLDWRIPIATGVAVVAFAGLEKFIGPVAGALAWAALVTSLFVPRPGSQDPPITAAAKFFNQG